MDLNKIIFKVFGEQILNSVNIENFDENTIQKNSDLPIAEHIAKVNYWLEEKLKQVEVESKDTSSQQVNLSRIGPCEVLFDIDLDSTVRVSNDKLTIRSQGSFNTTKANVCVYGGKWMYEYQLQSKGVMQIGWCSNQCTFNENRGVGDTSLSYGYDGSKQQIWHISTTKYGVNWQCGDTIGVCLDMDNEIIEYFRNGKSLGTAFRTIEKGPGIALFPAVSLAFNEGIKANFGGTPFRFPIDGYDALQSKPIDKLIKADLLLGYAINLARILSQPKYRKEKKSKDGKFSAKKTIYVMISLAIIEKLSDIIMDPYVIEDKLLLYIMNLCVLRSESDKDGVILPGSIDSTLGTLLSLLWNYLEDDEIKFVLKNLLNTLLSNFTQTSMNLEYENQRKVIVILNCICNHPETRKFYIENKFFKKHCLPLFMYLAPPEYSLMIEILPDKSVWTEGVGGSKPLYESACAKLLKSVEVLYALQKNLLKTLLTNYDGDSGTPSSRKVFLSKLRKYVIDSSMERPLQALFFLQSSFPTPLESPIALSFLCILTDTTRALIQEELREKKVFIDPKYFIDDTFRYQHLDRLGGVISHLKKIHRNEVMTFLGSDQDTSVSNDDDLIRSGGSDIDSTMFLISANVNTISILGRTVNNLNHDRTIIQESPGNISPERSLHELIDLEILYYYAVAHKHVVKISSVRDEIAVLNDILQETKYHRNDVENYLKDLKNLSADDSKTTNYIVNELKNNFNQRESVFAKRAIELGRKQTWYRSVALGPHRRNILIWLLDKTIRTLEKSSELGPLFAFVPEIYVNILPILLDAILDFSFHDLYEQFDMKDAEFVIADASAFLSEHSADPRIILASCKDALLQALGSITCHESGIKALENAPEHSQLLLVKSLLRPYENRAWGQSNWLLLRFWLGEGFANKDARPPNVWQGGNAPFSLGLIRSRAKNQTHTGLLHHIAPPYPSKHFQALIGKCLLEDESLSTSFLNSVLSQLNWAFSEFILLLQEIQNSSNRQEGETIFEPKQLKICSMCFQLTVSLMRCLEMIITIAPSVFQDPSRANSDLILNRVCQLVSQVLSRVTVPPGCFQYVIDICLSDLTSITHYQIITAAIGILLALMKEEINSDIKMVKITRVTRSILTDPSFQIATLEFAIGEVKTPIIQQGEIPRGNFNPQTRGHIDPLTNDVRVPAVSPKKIRAILPILKFSLYDYPTHVTEVEIENVRKLIDLLRITQSLMSDITLPSEDSLCPICCAKPVSVSFNPCKHQSCSNCILQHLMNNKLCFYCKAFIQNVETADGKLIYTNSMMVVEN